MSVEQLRDTLRPALNDFNQYFDELERHGRGQREVVGKKDNPLATFDRNYSRVVRLTELFYQLAGLDSLAKYLQYQPWRFTGGRPKEQVLPDAGERDVAALEAGERDAASRGGEVGFSGRAGRRPPCRDPAPPARVVPGGDPGHSLLL